MERRTFLGVIAGGLLAAPLVAEAQQPRTNPRLGILPSDPTKLRELDAFTKG
jgi:predicted small integral membrane protein